MAKFHYKAKRGLTEVTEGTIEAQSQEEALSKLVTAELFPISIAPAEEGAGKERRELRPRARRSKVDSKELLVFSQKLVTLLHAKVELLSSLKIIYEQTENAHLKEITLAIYEEVKEGKAFSETLASFPEIFSPLFINLVKAGEASGRLDYAFEHITEFLSQQQGLKTKITLALAYPVLLLFVGLASIFVLISFVVPKLRPMLEGAHTELPLITKCILSLSAFSSKAWLWLFIFIGILILVLYFRRGSTFFGKALRKVLTAIPLVKRLIDNRELVNFTRSLGLLLNSGVVALKALEIASSTLEDEKLKEQLKRVRLEIVSGQGLARSMDNLTDLPKFFTKMIAVGEESGRLSEVLDEITVSYTQQIEADIMLISSLLEPILILGIGLILGVIVLSILLPTFQITQMVR